MSQTKSNKKAKLVFLLYEISILIILSSFISGILGAGFQFFGDSYKSEDYALLLLYYNVCNVVFLPFFYGYKYN